LNAGTVIDCHTRPSEGLSVSVKLLAGLPASKFLTFVMSYFTVEPFSTWPAPPSRVFSTLISSVEASAVGLADAVFVGLGVDDAVFVGLGVDDAVFVGLGLDEAVFVGEAELPGV